MPLVHALEARFAQIPLILCGPMVRRVETDLVAVWVALKEAREIVLEVYTGYCSPADPAFSGKQIAFQSKRTPTIAIGTHLHLALVTIESLPPPAPGEPPTTVLLTHGTIYSYNLLFFKGPTETEDENLISLGLLQEPELLGFKAGQLPSFVVAPEKLKDLRMAHGSCRKPHGKGRDALATLARVMAPDFTQPDQVLQPIVRPHYLFHTGDQIYADDCSNFLIQHYTDAGNFLLQKVERMPYPKVPEDFFSKQGTQDSDFVWMQITSAALPPNRRATNFYSGFTGSQSNHLYSFAEYAAAYLFQWCDVLWPPALPTSEAVFKDRINDHPATRSYLFPLIKEGEEEEDQEPEVPANWNDLSEDDRMLALFPEPTQPVLVAAQKRYARDHQQQKPDDAPKERERVEEFRAGLKAVRRVLANVPAIMSFDDHDVTDDWYLNGGWTKRALGSRLGEAIIRNGLLAFALFQAWGNDPRGWADQNPGANARSLLLAEIPKMVAAFKPLQEEGPLITDTMPPGYEGLPGKFHAPLGFAAFNGSPADDPRVKWHCFLKIGPTQVFVLDTRTRRDFSLGLDFPPNLISKEALAEQIPDNALAFSTELAIVVSGAPVLGLAAIEAIGQPIVSRVLDVKNTFGEKANIKKREAGHKKGRDSLDVEHWSIHVAGYEALLKRCAALKKVLFLAGDVHYGISCEMDYWVKGAPEAARYIQMVSSSLKNIKPEGQLLGLLPAALTQLALAGGLNREFSGMTSLGWEKEEDIKKLKLRVQTAPGTFADARPGQFPVRFAYALAKQPVFIALRDWPLHEYKEPGNEETVKLLPRIVFSKDCPEPSFRWRMQVLLDARPDSERFRALSAVFPELIADLPKYEYSGAAYQAGLEKILLRQAFFSRNHLNRHVNWYSHIGLIHFEQRGEEAFALHSQFFTPQLPPPDNQEPGNMATPFFRHEASLSRKPVSERPDFPVETTPQA